MYSATLKGAGCEAENTVPMLKAHLPLLWPSGPRRIRHSSIWPKDENIILISFSPYFFETIPMKSFLYSTAAEGWKENSYSVKQLQSYESGSYISAIMHLSFSCSNSLPCHAATFSGSHSRFQPLLLISATCSFVFLSVYFFRLMTGSSISALLQIPYTCSTLLPLVPFKALNPLNPWHFTKTVYCCTFPKLRPLFWH